MQKPLVMIVEDEVEVASEMEEIIKSSGKYEILRLLSANEAWTALKNNSPSLIFLDIKMPEMDGLQLLEKIRKEYSHDIKVVVVTAFEDENEKDVILRLGAKYLTKPFKRKELLQFL